MTRYYLNDTTVTLDRACTGADRLNAVEAYEQLCDVDSCTLDGNEISLSGSCHLSGGTSAKEAHDQLVREFRERFPRCRVETEWRCYDDWPSKSYVTRAARSAPRRGSARGSAAQLRVE